jgi:hypothetical protein
VPAWFVLTDVARVGVGGARIVSPDQRCRWDGGWQWVHVLDAVLLPAAAARYAAPGPYAVTQSIFTLPRSKGRSEAAAAMLRAFVQEMKASGFVAQALARHNIQGASVAPL